MSFPVPLLNAVQAMHETYASRAVQFHPHGGQSDFVLLAARTEGPHGGASYVWRARRNQRRHPPEIYYRPLCWAGLRRPTGWPSLPTARSVRSGWGGWGTRTRSQKRVVIFFGWVFFLISLGGQAPHVRPMGRTCGELDGIELTRHWGEIERLTAGTRRGRRSCTTTTSQVRVPSRSIPPRWRSIQFRLAARTYDASPWGVRVVGQTKSRKAPTRKILPCFAGQVRMPAGWTRSWTTWQAE